MPEETNQLIEKVHSIPVVKELKESWDAKAKMLSDLHPSAKSTIDALTSLINKIIEFLSGYTSYVDPYASKGTAAIDNLQETFPALKKPSAEMCQEFHKQLMSQIPDSVKETIKSALLTILDALLSTIKQVKGSGEIGSMKQIVDNALSSFNQVKVAADYASSLAENVSQNETAISAAKTSTDAILKQLGPEAKKKYESLPDATSKAQFIAEEGWKTVTKQLSAVNEQVAAKLPEPLKTGYTALVSLANKVSENVTQQLPTNEDMLKKINSSVDTITQYLETLQKSLSSSESAAL